jgi:hypothetical protein
MCTCFRVQPLLKWAAQWSISKSTCLFWHAIFLWKQTSHSKQPSSHSCIFRRSAITWVMSQTFQVMWLSKLSNGWNFSLPSVLQHTTLSIQSSYPSSPCHFNARVLWHFSTHWLSCNVRVHLSLNFCNNSLKHLKSIPIFSTILSALDSTIFTLQHCPLRESKTKQLNFYIMLGTMNPNVFHNITLLQSRVILCLIQSWFF